MEMLKSMKARLMALSFAVVGSTAALAGGEGLDYSDLTDSVNFDDVGPAVLAAAGALVGVYIIVKGIRIILGFVRS